MIFGMEVDYTLNWNIGYKVHRSRCICAKPKFTWRCLSKYNFFQSYSVTLKHTKPLFQVRQILTQFEYIAQDTNSAAAHINSEEIVWLAVQRSVAGLLKTSAVDSFYDEVSLYSVDEYLKSENTYLKVVSNFLIDIPSHSANRWSGRDEIRDTDSYHDVQGCFLKFCP